MKPNPADRDSLILCIIDFSEFSIKTLSWAVKMAETLQAKVTVLHTYRLDPFIKKEDVIITKKNIEKAAEKDFTKLANGIFQNGNFFSDFSSEVGFVIDRIEDHIRKKKIEFIVMEKNSALTNQETTIELIEHTKVPLVIVP